MSAVKNIALQLIGNEHSFTKSEQKIARVLLADYPAAGLSTVASLADKAKVSAPTVIRFINELGFASYKDFQECLRTELSQRETSTLQQVSDQQAQTPSATSSALNLLHQVESSLITIPEKELQQAITLLGATSKKIFATGGDYSSVAAEHLVLQLIQLRPYVHLLPSKAILAAATLCDSKKGDILCVYDVRRYSPHTLRITKAAKELGMKIVLFTDKWLSPIASFADVVIPAEVESDSANDSSVSLLAVTEYVCNQVAATLTPLATTRLEKLDQLRLRIES
ncbi:MurR/RpiR family transcriptional regulator [Corynebacterium sp. sy017]|uniref:MurR/RpiR family transcriptional regulator n=1 Tax=unclassified Corynebacterium TaxID=2624378 RepID=UPI001184FB8A|nr:MULTISPECIES: MurR/RpiR family transcriptional regulator [unclassified Corynebacterium]MBP3087905.1 MurR/RpiR family transcriptional regulator [Corynebacterium sp. sy017]TSD92446.1 MurR/RpiR family transcriptional regulator [Corynebacterium sp. SY003]